MPRVIYLALYAAGRLLRNFPARFRRWEFTEQPSCRPAEIISNICSLTLYYCLSCGSNTEEVLLCSTRCTVLSGTCFLYLAVNRQGAIVHNLPYTPPVIYRVIFQIVFGVGVPWTPIVPTCGTNFIIYSLAGAVWTHPIYEMADPNICHYQRMSVLNCAISLGREGPGSC